MVTAAARTPPGQPAGRRRSPTCRRQSRRASHPPALRYDAAVYFDERHILASQRSMIEDSVRTNAYAEAIGRVVGKGAVVLDLGSGSGVLAILACRAGARKVFA